jgi:hypothetical protein
MRTERHARLGHGGPTGVSIDPATTPLPRDAPAEPSPSAVSVAGRRDAR